MIILGWILAGVLGFLMGNVMRAKNHEKPTLPDTSKPRETVVTREYGKVFNGMTQIGDSWIPLGQVRAIDFTIDGANIYFDHPYHKDAWELDLSDTLALKRYMADKIVVGKVTSADIVREFVNHD